MVVAFRISNREAHWDNIEKRRIWKGDAGPHKIVADRKS